MSKLMLLGLLGLAFVAQIAAHGHLSVPANRGYLKRQDENNAPVAFPLKSDFVCRDDGATPANLWTTLVAGQPANITWALEAAHPGDCFAYISYDISLPDTEKKWFKVAQFNKCNLQNLQTQRFTVPSYLPSCEHCILRWEWYALHLREINIVEFYSQCADVKIVGSSSGQLPTPQVKIPGHIPMDAKFYRNDYKDPATVLFTGPPIATVGGANYDCKSTYDGSCDVAPVTNNPCEISHQRCVTATTYQACGIGTTTTVWGPEQSCQTGLNCYDHPDGAHIICNYPTPGYTPPTLPPSTPATPTPSTPAPSTRVTTGRSTPAGPTTPATTGIKRPDPYPTPQPTAQPDTPSTSSCTLGNQKCAGDSIYQTCSQGRDSTYWSQPQSCQAGLFCVPNGNNVYCGYTPSTPNTPPSTPNAPSTPSTPSSLTTGRKPSTPVTTGKTVSNTPPSSSTSCVLGYQRCSGSNGYQTCGNGRNGPEWSPVQQCQTGLSCHLSPTANNIYCY
jgi:hypothetical protein